MEYDTTFALSDQYTLQDVYARVKNYLGKEVSTDPRLSPGNIINAIGVRIQQMYNLAYDAVKDDYTQDEPGMAVSSGVIDLAAAGLVRVKEVIALTYGTGATKKNYEKGENRKHFNETQDVSNGSEQAGARVFLYLRGEKKILVGTGPGVTGETPLTVTYVRVPMSRFTLGEVDDTDNYIDVGDEWINFVVIGAAWDLSAEQREQMNPQLQSDYSQFVQQLDQTYGVNKARREAMNKD